MNQAKTALNAIKEYFYPQIRIDTMILKRARVYNVPNAAVELSKNVSPFFSFE
jgi:hypothetical protein